GVTDGASRALVIHGVAALAFRVGRLDDDVATEVGHLAPVQAFSLVIDLEGPIQGHFAAVDGLDAPFLGGDVLLVGLVLRGRDDAAVAGLPDGGGISQGEGAATLLRGGAGLAPGPAQRCAVKIHATAAADDGGTRLPVHALEVNQANQGGVPGLDGFVWRAN